MSIQTPALVAYLWNVLARNDRPEATKAAAALSGALPALRAGGDADALVEALIVLATAVLRAGVAGDADELLDEAANVVATVDVSALRRVQLDEARGRLAKSRDDFPAAERWYASALDGARAGGPATRDMIPIVLTNLGDTLEKQGRYPEAAGNYEEASRLVQDPIEVGGVLSNQGRVLRRLGRFKEAIAALTRSLDERRKIEGGEAIVAESLSLLASAEADAGHFDVAKRRFAEALAAWEEIPGSGVERAKVHQNLAMMYRDLEDWDGSQRAFEQAYEALASAESVPEEVLAVLEDNVGGLESRRGDNDKARTLMSSALARFERIRPDHREAGVTRYNLVLLDVEDGRLAAAEAAIETGLADPAALPLAQAGWWNLLGDVRMQQLRLPEAIEAARTARRLQLEVLPATHPEVILGSDNLVKALAAGGQLREAWTEIVAVERARDEYLDTVFAIQSEIERLRTMSRLQGALHLALSLALQLADDPQVVREAFELVARRQAVVAESTALSIGLDAGSGDERIRRLELVRAELGTQSLDPTADPDRVRQLAGERAALEEELAATFPSVGFVQRMRDATAAAVAASLPARSALLDVVLHRAATLADPTAAGSPHYAAFILSAGALGSLRLVDLGSAASLDEAIRDWRETITGSQERLRGANPAATVAHRLFEPFPEVLKATDHLLVVADGALARAPLCALPAGDGRLLIDHVAVSLVDSARDVLGWATRTSAPAGQPYVAGHIDFSAGPAEWSEPVPPPLPFQKITFADLASTEEEAIEVARLLKVAPAMRTQPLESVVKGLVSPRILHLATHGVFRTLDQTDGVRDPMLRSFVTLVGFNPASLGRPRLQGAEDGALTGEDVVSMSLAGTEVVVLSACETGLGEIVDNEGIFGLRRAFTLAGAATVVMSLWLVPDAETKDLMIAFHRALDDGASPSVALRSAQSAVRSTKDDPKLWAGFVVAGRP